MVEAVDSFVLAPKPRTLDQIPPRPPTPPRESARSISRQSAPKEPEQGGTDEDDIPPSSPPREVSPPSSSAESASGRPKKRVGWSPWTTYHKPGAGLSTPSSRPLPRSSTSADGKSLRSILKPYSSPLFSSSPVPENDRPIAAHTHASFTSMLESVVKALASSERSKKLDTYINFSNTLKAYDEVPDMRSMQENLPSLSGYLRRDLNAKMEDGGNPDSQLIQQAIKLMTIICWTPKLVEVLDEQNASFFFQHAIQKVEDVETSKLSVNLYLHFLAQQKFPSRVVTAERCNRLITALESLDQRVSGKAISKERIDVYHKLICQNRTAMLARVNDWMDNTFAGLFSGVKEVRSRAFVCMAEVARTMGSERSVSRTVTNIFNREVEGKKMFESIRQRLEHFVKEGEGIFVARMWAVILLVVRAAGDKWEFFVPWLRVIETCFNVSDKDVKVEAQMAWSKLIYAMNIGPNTTRKLLELLCKPLEQYLDPKNAISNTRKPRKAAMVNISVLLYYGFRPNAPPKHVSEIWDVVVVGLVERMALASRAEEVMDGCNILSALFDVSTQKVWSEQRVLVGALTIKPEDLPRLDPKWVRSNCATILKTIEVALRRGTWESDPPSQGAKTLWMRFMRCLGDAGSKEIKISTDLMEAVAHLFNLFKRFWNEGQPGFSTQGEGTLLQKFIFLVECTLDSLGTLCFTEKQLAYTEDSKFIPAATPTHRYSSDSNDATKYPPILHLFRLFMSPPEGVPLDEDYYTSVKTLLAKCCNSQDSRRKKLQLLSSCESLLPRRDPSQVDRGLWSIIAKLTMNSLPTPAREKSLLSPSPAGGDLKDAVQILKWGFSFDIPCCEQFFNELVSTVQSELGDAYVAMIIIEPLAESLRYQKPGSSLPITLTRAKLLADRANPAKKRPTFENNLKVQLGAFDRKLSNSEPFEGLYSLIDQLLQQAYASHDAKDLVPAIKLLASAVDLVSRIPPGAISPLKSMQQGFGVWAADPDRLVTSSNNISAATLTNLWAKILQAVEKLSKHDSVILSNLCVLISSGLESRRKATANATIKLWNETFGQLKVLSYPKRVQKALRRLRPIADLSLPSFPEDSDTGIHTPPEFTESQDTDEGYDIFSSPTPARLAAFTDPRSRSRTSSPAIVKETPFPTRVRRSITPKPKVTPTRPKHMDSQIEFAVIDTMPDNSTLDSQLLTEHQKDVKEKQAETSTIFSALGNASAGPEVMGVEAQQTPKTDSEKQKRSVEPQSDHSVDENFVDAPEVHVLSDGEENSRSKKITEITVEISPIKDRSRHALNRMSYASPEAQIMTEANGTSTRKNRKGKKRKRTSSIPKEAPSPPASPEMLDTIVIAGASLDMSSQATDDEQPSAKRNKSNKRSSGHIDSSSPRLSRKTRSSAKVDNLEGAASKSGPSKKGIRKRQSASFEGDLGEETRDLSVSPSPKGRQNVINSKRKSSKHSKNLQGTKDNPSNKADISFVEETQLGQASFVPDSQESITSVIGSTPIKGRGKARGIFSGLDNMDELQSLSPQHTLRNSVLSSGKGEKSSIGLIQADPNSPLQHVASASQPEEQGESTHKGDFETAQEDLESKNGDTSSGHAIATMRAAFALMDKTMLSSEECRLMENEIFDAFTKIRHRRQSGVRIRDA